MLKEEMTQIINDIIKSSSGYGFEVYACLTIDGQIRYKQFILEDKDTDSFKDSVCKKITDYLSEKFLSEEYMLKPSYDISDNTNDLYEIVQDDNYAPFSFINSECDGIFSINEKHSLLGFLFKFILNEKCFWAYQQVYPMAIPQKKKSVLVYTKDNIFCEFSKELLKIDYRVDLLIVDNSIITYNIKLLQRKFAFEDYIRKESQQTIDLLMNMNIIEDMSKIIAFEGTEKLTNAKKLMKIKNSPVLKMEKSTFINRLQTIPRFVGMLSIHEGRIRITTNKDVTVLLKILNDDYLISELTGSNYESQSKTLEEAT